MRCSIGFITLSNNDLSNFSYSCSFFFFNSQFQMHSYNPRVIRDPFVSYDEYQMNLSHAIDEGISAICIVDRNSAFKSLSVVYSFSCISRPRYCKVKFDPPPSFVLTYSLVGSSWWFFFIF